MPAQINRREYSWTDISIHMLGNTRPLVGVNEISWSTEAANELHHGIGREPVAHTRGAIKYSGTIKFHKGELDGLKAALPSGTRLWDLNPFSIVVSYEADLQIATTILHGVLFTKDDQSNSKGTTLLEGSLSFVFSSIEEK